MKLIIFISLLSIILSCSTELKNIVEKKDFTKMTSYNELIDFIIESENKSDLIDKEFFAVSSQGRKIPVLKFSSDNFTNSNKLKVLIFAQQHGNEQSGKEGAILLINELLKPENQYLFDKIDFVLVPQMNPDGSEVNKRRNGNNMDLNRNHLILTEPETIGLHKLFNKYLFEVSMDVHEYSPYGKSWKKYGYRANNDEEVGTLTNINVSSKIRELSNKTYLPYIKKYLNDRHFSYFEYCPGGPPETAYIRHSTFDINDGRQSFGIQNTFSFIQEGLNGEDNFSDNIEHRAEGQMTGMLGLLEFAYNHKEEIKNLVASERDELINNNISNTVSIQLDHFKDGSKLELPLLSYYSNKDTVVTVNDYHPLVKSLYDVKRPQGYLVPKNLTDIIEWADKHSLKYYDYKKLTGEKIEQYHINAIDSIDFEGDIVANPIVQSEVISNTFSENNYIFIPTKQLKNNMIVTALEPKSILGIMQYKEYRYLLDNKLYPILRVIKEN